MKKIIFQNYSVNEYEDSARELLAERGVKKPELGEIINEAYFLQKISWEDKKKRLEKIFSEGLFIAKGTVQRWDNAYPGGFLFESFEELESNLLQDCDYFSFFEEDGNFYAQGTHRDGTNMVQIKKITKKGEKEIEKWEETYEDNRSFNQISSIILEKYSEDIHFSEQYCKATTNVA